MKNIDTVNMAKQSDLIKLYNGYLSVCYILCFSIHWQYFPILNCVFDLLKKILEVCNKGHPSQLKGWVIDYDGEIQEEKQKCNHFDLSFQAHI